MITWYKFQIKTVPRINRITKQHVYVFLNLYNESTQPGFNAILTSIPVNGYIHSAGWDLRELHFWEGHSGSVFFY